MKDIDTIMLWPKDNQKFYRIEDESTIVTIRWSKNYAQDYKNLAESYALCAYTTCKEFVGKHDNRKTDMWFLANMYMFRQSLELMLKALICRIKKNGGEIQTAFKLYKHDLSGLFKEYLKENESCLENDELIWVEKYLDSLEMVDAKSDLFRFPFDDEFLSKYRDKFLDVYNISKNFIQCYLLLKKCFEKGIVNKNIKFDTERNTEFLQLANHGIGNCYLWEDANDDGFYKQIAGYGEVAEFLLFECKEISNNDKAYPILFLQRNLLELSLKRIFYKKINNGIDKKIFNSKRKSHLLHKELWKYVKPVIEYYFKQSEKELPILELVGEHLKVISEIDKKGDVFRYPTGYNLQYNFNNKTLDLKNVYCYMQAIFNFLDANDSGLSEIEDFESRYYD